MIVIGRHFMEELKVGRQFSSHRGSKIDPLLLGVVSTAEVRSIPKTVSVMLVLTFRSAG